MAEEIIGSDSLRIIANNRVIEGGAVIIGMAENLRFFAFWGVSVFSTQNGELLIEYRMADGIWRSFPVINIAADTVFDQVYRKTREEYRVTYTDTSEVESNVDLETMRTNVN